MRVCPLCQARYEDDVRKCPYDGRRPLAEAVVAAAGGDGLLGATVAARYTIVGRVGAGGMGTVYRAEQSPMNREIALKVLRRDLGRDPETVARFHREAHTLSALKHPNTVTIFDFGQTDDGLLFLAMELLEGEMLSSRLKRVGAMDVPLAIRIASGVLRSLGEAHERGIIHRDLKPDNIFLAQVHGRAEEAEMVKVVDFGIAKIRDGDRGLEPLQTQEGTVFGTPRYMSPEQAQGKPLDGRSDLYAVGVLLFHMLTGRPPFTDDDAVVVMAHHIKTVPPPVREAAPDRPIPVELESLVRRALEKDADARPQSAELFLAELEGTLAAARTLAAAALAPGLTMPAPAVVPVDNTRRRLTVFAAASLAVVAIIAAVATAGPRHGPTTARAPVHAAQPMTPTPMPAVVPAPPPALPVDSTALLAVHDGGVAAEPHINPDPLAAALIGAATTGATHRVHGNGRRTAAQNSRGSNGSGRHRPDGSGYTQWSD